MLRACRRLAVESYSTEDHMPTLKMPEPEQVKGACPHCGVGVAFVMHHADRGYMGHYGMEPPELSTTGALEGRKLFLRTYHCPLCNGLVIDLVERRYQFGGDHEQHPTRLFPLRD